MPDLTTEIKGHTLEYIDESHTYVVDGIVVPSITTVLRKELGKKYDKVPVAVLKRRRILELNYTSKLKDIARPGTPMVGCLNYRTSAS